MSGKRPCCGTRTSRNRNWTGFPTPALPGSGSRGSLASSQCLRTPPANWSYTTAGARCQKWRVWMDHGRVGREGLRGAALRRMIGARWRAIFQPMSAGRCPRCRRIRKDGLTPNMTTANGRPTFAEIDLDALRANYRALCAYTDGASIMAVVKADAYGHGAVEVARTLRQEGCAHFGVATVEEARELRAAGIGERLYLLAGYFAEQAPEIVALDVTAAIFDLSLIEPLERAASNAGRIGFRVHLEIDTGATRLGIMPVDLAEAAERLHHALGSQARRREYAARQCGRSLEPDNRSSTRRLSRCRRDAQSRGLRCAGAPRRQLGGDGAARGRPFHADAPGARDVWATAGARRARTRRIASGDDAENAHLADEVCSSRQWRQLRTYVRRAARERDRGAGGRLCGRLSARAAARRRSDGARVVARPSSAQYAWI